jgi:hypothetical protein
MHLIAHLNLNFISWERRKIKNNRSSVAKYPPNWRAQMCRELQFPPSKAVYRPKSLHPAVSADTSTAQRQKTINWEPSYDN